MNKPVRSPRFQGKGMNARRLLFPESGWLDSPTTGRVAATAFTAFLGLAIYGFTVGFWRDPLLGCYVALKMPLLVALTLGCNGLLNGLLGLLLGTGLGFRQSLLALLTAFAQAAVILGSIAPVTFFLALNAPRPDAPNAVDAHSAYLILHTFLIGFAGIVSNIRLHRMLAAKAPTRTAAAATLLAWLAGNGFLGAQFSWILRPFFGSPSIKVQFLRDDPLNGTFYETVWHALNNISDGAAWLLLPIILAALGLPILHALLTQPHQTMNDTTSPSAAQPPPLVPPLPGKLDLKSLFEGLLRQPQALVARLAEPNHGATGRLALMAVVSILLFGFVLGCFAKHEQLWAAPLKITAGLAFAGVICFPSLYIFSTLAGARVSMGQLAACLAGALALAALLLLGFAPAVWIFAESTDSLGFMGFLALASWMIAVLFALRFLDAAIRAAGGSQKAPILVWSIVFMMVTLQMTTSLRPILGRSDQFLTQEKKFFLEHWSDSAGKSLKPATAKVLPKTELQDLPARQD